MENKKITAESFCDLAYYNGHEEVFKKIYEYLKEHKNDEYTIPFPPFLDVYHCNDLPRTFWSILVIEYGDYGTSPRYGWIEVENVERIIEEMESFYESIKELIGK
jgi:hypothetical protein